MPITGEEYATAISAVESNRRARDAFIELVMSHCAPDAQIFDFGAGPGIDALRYVQRGLRVAAYDVDPLMCDSFAARCSAPIVAGRVRLQRGGYDEFLRTPSLYAGSVDVVTANFAPLSMIDDLPQLFAKFAELTARRGKVIASVLNPWSLHDVRYAWWWRNQPRYWRRGEYSIAGPGYRIHRRSMFVLARAAGAHFTLVDSRPKLLAPGRVMSGFLFAVFERN
jgi:SAM-dependent methyltransferase